MRSGRREGPVTVIDLFAGPGGLGEGFAGLSAADGERAFRIGLSIEKDSDARTTLRLRSFFRQFWPASAVPDAYYRYVAGEITWQNLVEAFPEQAEAAEGEAWRLELGPPSHDVVRDRIARVLGESPGHWVLIGGPPCQAYSLAGRSRMKGEIRRQGGDESAFDHDHRHVLYREYLRIIADHRPALFVMENVPGLLSSTLNGSPIITRIVDDLKAPRKRLGLDEGAVPLGYRLYSLVAPEPGAAPGNNEPGTDAPDDSAEPAGVTSPRDFIVRADDYGVPQARQRMLIVGVRGDLHGRPEPLTPGAARLSVMEAIGDLPPLRSHLSREPDTDQAWRGAVRAVGEMPWLSRIDPAIQNRIRLSLRRIASPETAHPRGVDDGTTDPAPECPVAADYHRHRADARLVAVPNHVARAHIRADLWRYLFAASFAAVKGVSPKLHDFPKDIWPHHDSITKATDPRKVAFADRFRVQVATRPSTTVVAHISRDGHYYIHPDPVQCRSLTVREAARLQSFPDNYVFEGPRTSQYAQVGNAVPPLLARQVARVVHAFLSARSPEPLATGIPAISKAHEAATAL